MQFLALPVVVVPSDPMELVMLLQVNALVTQGILVSLAPLVLLIHSMALAYCPVLPAIIQMEVNALPVNAHPLEASIQAARLQANVFANPDTLV